MDKQEREAFLAYSHLPKFKRQVAEALKVIQEALAIAPIESQIVGVSWGKDSVVMLHLIQQIEPSITAVFSAGYWMESYDNFNEVQGLYCQAHPTNMIVIEETKDESLAKRTMPAPKKALSALTHSVVYLGLRKQESKHRRISLCRYGNIHQYSNGITRVCPLANWETTDVWAYIVSRHLPYLNSYDLSSKLSHESRTTPHITPAPGKTALGAEVRERLSMQSHEFRQLLKEFSP